MPFYLIITFLFIPFVLSSGIDYCDGTGSESDEYWFIVDMSVFETVLGAVILTFTIISVLPQAIKIVRRKDGEGLSPTYLLLLTCNQVFAGVNTTILNFPTIKSCPEVGLKKCIPPLLSYLQMMSLVVLEFIIFALFLIFYKEKSKLTYKRAIGFFVLSCVFLLVSILLVFVSEYWIGECHPFTDWFAYVFGICSSIVTFVEYLPQIWRTFRTKSCGSLSLTANSIQTVGCFVIVCYMFFSTHQHITTLATYVVSFIQHSILVALQIKYDYIDVYCCKKKTSDYDDIESQDGNPQQIITENEEKEIVVEPVRNEVVKIDFPTEKTNSEEQKSEQEGIELEDNIVIGDSN